MQERIQMTTNNLTLQISMAIPNFRIIRVIKIPLKPTHIRAMTNLGEEILTFLVQILTIRNNPNIFPLRPMNPIKIKVATTINIQFHLIVKTNPGITSNNLKRIQMKELTLQA